MLHHLTKVTRTATIVEPSLLSRSPCPIAPDTFINHNTIMGERIMVSNKSIMARSLAIFWLDQSTTIGGGYLHTKGGSLTRDRSTQLSLVLNIMTHTKFSRSNLSVSSAVVNPLFSSMSSRGESFATSASAKQKQAHCLGLSRSTSTRIPSWRRLQA